VNVVADALSRKSQVNMMVAHPMPYGYHYRKHINFRGLEYFRWPAHENTAVIFVGLLTDENVEYFHGPDPC
jgi:hypothetical protein